MCYAFRYGYGKEGKKEYDIGSNAELVYEVTLKDFEKVRYFILDLYYLVKAFWMLPKLNER